MKHIVMRNTYARKSLWVKILLSRLHLIILYTHKSKSWAFKDSFKKHNITLKWNTKTFPVVASFHINSL